MSYLIDNDGQRVEMASEYDETEDIMYSWVGAKPQNGVAYETPDGHLVMLNPETDELVGVTIFDYKARWEGFSIQLQWEVRERAFLGRTRERKVERVLQPA